MTAGCDTMQGLAAAFAAGKLTRTEFTARFSAWQRQRGEDFGCKGIADGDGLHLSYRGVTATMRDGQLEWGMGFAIDRKGRRVPVHRSAGTVFEFRRKVDADLLREFLQKGGSRCREVTFS